MNEPSGNGNSGLKVLATASSKLPSYKSIELQSLAFLRSRLSPVISENIRATSLPESELQSEPVQTARLPSERCGTWPTSSKQPTLPNSPQQEWLKNKKLWGRCNWCSLGSIRAKETFKFILQDWNKVTHACTHTNKREVKGSQLWII